MDTTHTKYTSTKKALNVLNKNRASRVGEKSTETRGLTASKIGKQSTETRGLTSNIPTYNTMHFYNPTSL